MEKILISKLLFLILLIIHFVSTSSLLYADYTKNNKADLRFLNKYTGKTELATLTVGQNYIFDNGLYVLLRTCYKSSIQDDPENKAFLQVVRVVKEDNQSDVRKTLDIELPKDFRIKIENNEVTKFIFSGWLFSSSPSVNFLEDKTYDITLLHCSN